MALYSIGFLFFLFIMVLTYRLVPQKMSNLWLLCGSIFFYLFAGVKGLFIALGVGIISYLFGLLLSGYKSRFVFVVSIIVVVSPLLMLKYSDFFLKTVGISVNPIENLKIGIPLGISFFTLQAVSYLIDIRNNKVKAEKNIISYLVYFMFFAYITSGPIERAGNVLPQLKHKKISYENMCYGAQLLLWGMFQKLVIAERFQVVANTVYDNFTYYSGFEMLLGTIAYSFQIFFDFAGYSNMAVGIAQMFGINIMQNFEQPYLSKSIAEFWRRWHISLSSWLKDYIYIPLGGNRKGKLRKYVNIMIVFLVSGLWHGASWHFVIWGGLHGMYQVIGGITLKARERLCEFLKIRRESKGFGCLQIFINFNLVNIAWIFFRSDSVSQAIEIIKRIFAGFSLAGSFGIKKIAEWPWRNVIGLNLVTQDDKMFYLLGLDMDNLLILIFSVMIAVIVEFLHRYKRVSLRKIIGKEDLWFRWLIYLAAIFLVLTFGIYGSYDASSFIYANF